MVEADAVNYIKKQLQNGYSEEEVRSALLNSGWSEKDINDAFFVVHGESQPVHPQNQVQAQAQQQTEEDQGLQEQQPQMPEEPLPEEEQEKPLPQPGKPLGQENKRSFDIFSRLRIGALVSVAGGVMIFVNYAMINYLNMEDLMLMFYQEVQLISLFTPELAEMAVLAAGILPLLFGILILIKPKLDLYFGIGIAILGLVSVLIGNGYIIGGVLSIAGGSLSIIRK